MKVSGLTTTIAIRQSNSPLTAAINHLAASSARCGLTFLSWKNSKLLPQERKRRNRRKGSTFAGFVVGEDALARSYQGTSGSVEEKSQIQALDRTQPLLAMRPGQVKRRTHDYARHGMTCLFAALDVKTRKIIGEYHRRPTSGATAPCPVVARPGESLPE